MPPPLADRLEHRVKCWPGYFAAIIDGQKRFEVRANDRDYQTGDTITLCEWDEATLYTGREVTFTIGYMTTFSQREGYVVFALVEAAAELDRREAIVAAAEAWAKAKREHEVVVMERHAHTGNEAVDEAADDAWMARIVPLDKAYDVAEEALLAALKG